MVKSSQYVELANDLEINKAITYLRQKDFKQVRAAVHDHHRVGKRLACSRAAPRAALGRGPDQPLQTKKGSQIPGYSKVCGGWVPR